jgi:hypothetical protein
MQLAFEQYIEGSGSLLECPSCHGNHLHHGKVEIFDRLEDQDIGLHVVVADGTAAIDKDLWGNPSSRRHGLRIHFACEHCSATPMLTIAQHKGNTWVDFNFNS